MATFRIVVTNNRYRQDKKGVLKLRLVAVRRLHDRSAAPELRETVAARLDAALGLYRKD